jgi:sarcosine oxidase
MGSSHGSTRITRLAVGEGPQYVPLVQRSHQLWRDIEVLTGEDLMLQTGGLVIGPGDGGGELHGESDFVSRTIAVARQFGLAHEALDARAVAQRWPQFMLRGDERCCFEPTAGILRPERCVAAQIELARRDGARIAFGETVLAVEADGGGVAVITSAETHHAARAVLAAGGWLPALVGEPLALRLQVQRQTLHWFRPDDAAAFTPSNCPVFIWSHGGTSAEAFYGFPMADGIAGVKVATQQYEHSIATPDAMDRDVAATESTQVFERHVRGRLRAVTPQRVHAVACPYTVQAQARFVIERHPRVEAALLASACSGHGFKHSAALGEALAETLLQGRSTIDIAPFGWQ